MLNDKHWIKYALTLAEKAEQEGEVPIGAVLVRGEEIIGEGWNQPIKTNDPTAHAEIVALREAAKKIGNYRLLNTTMYVTLEPCPMCVGALLYARVERVVYAAYDSKAGAVTSMCRLLDDYPFNHCIKHEGGILQEESVQLLKEFFLKRRGKSG